MILPAVVDGATGFLPYQAETGGSVMYPLRHDAKTLVRQLGLTNPFDYYCRFVEWLAGQRTCHVRQMRNLMAPAHDNRVAVGLRHDMDTEPYSSVEVARALHAAGLSGSFYVLHTADYYGQWFDGVFRRNADIAPMLRQVQDDFGCEVGLHNDALWVYQQNGADGSQAVTEELAWLRSEGVSVVGTAAHNSAPLYGAENFEIWKGRAALSRTALPFGDRTIPLQTLDEDALGLAYEANFPSPTQHDSTRLRSYLAGSPDDAVRNPTWMRTYLVDNPHTKWGAHYNLWLIGEDRWVIGGRRWWRTTFMWDATLVDVQAFLSGLAAPCRVVLHIHPVYIDLPDSAEVLG
jgi:hypothetical protein